MTGPTMTTTVKDQLMNAILAVLSGIAAFEKVDRLKTWPLNLDLVPLPAAFFFESGEDTTWHKGGLAAQVQLKLTIWIFIQLSPAGPVGFYPTADDLQGQVHAAIVSLVQPGNPGANFYVLDSESSRDDIPNDELGVRVLTMSLKYYHSWGNAYATL